MFLSVFMWHLCKCNCWLITEVNIPLVENVTSQIISYTVIKVHFLLLCSIM